LGWNERGLLLLLTFTDDSVNESEVLLPWRLTDILGPDTKVV